MSEKLYCDWLDTKVCAVCGKHFSVLYPQLWCYKFGFAKKAIWFCSYGCMRVHDKKKEERIVKKITLNEKKRAVEEALAGKDPREYLKSIGVGNPNTCWETIQRYYRTNDPETYRKICEAGFGRKCDTEPVAVAAKVAKVKITGPVEIETPEAKKVEVVETPELKMGPIPKPTENIDVPPLKPGLRGLNSSDFEVSAIKHPCLGEFYYDQKFNMIDWRTPEGEEVSMSPKAWKELYLLIPDVMGILRVVDDDE